MPLPTYVQEKRKILVEKVIKDIEKGKPFFWDSGHLGKTSGTAINAVTGNRYRGGNAIRLFVSALEQGYTDNRWLTFDQAKNHGWKVKKGAKGTHIEFWKAVVQDVEEINSTAEKKESETPKMQRPIVRNYVVFNAEQVEGIPLEASIVPDQEDVNQHMENMLKNSEAKIYCDQLNKNFYHPRSDEIHVMPREKFKSLDQFYATCAHEIAHSTGHEKRLSRSSIMPPPHGEKRTEVEYAKEELRAEMASMFIQQQYGIAFDTKHYENHAAYLQSWAKVLKNDSNELYRAAADAEKAVEYIESKMIYREFVQAKVPDKNIDLKMQTVDIGRTRIAQLPKETIAYVEKIEQETKNYVIAANSPLADIARRRCETNTNEQKTGMEKPSKRVLRVVPAKENSGRNLEMSR